MGASGKGRSIVIIGNGPPGTAVDALVDAADLVIRFNGCRTYGAAGRRTDVVAVCNTGRPAKDMLEGGWRDLVPVREAEAIWCVRHPGALAARQADILARRPDLSDFFEDRTGDFARFAATSGKRAAVLPAGVHERLDRALAPFGQDYVVPSSGLFVIDHVLADLAEPGDSVSIVGFGHQGWEGHPFAAERQLVDEHAGAGRLRRLDG